MLILSIKKNDLGTRLGLQLWHTVMGKKIVREVEVWGRGEEGTVWLFPFWSVPTSL